MHLEKKIQSKININKIPREITKKLQPYCTVPLRGIGVASVFGMASTGTPFACSYNYVHAASNKWCIFKQ